jgi:hypothetical protein
MTNRTYINTETAETSAAAIWQKIYLTKRSPPVRDWVATRLSKALLKLEAMEFKPLAMGTNAVAEACMKP